MSSGKFNKKCYKETMDALHASEDTLMEVFDMAENKNRSGMKGIRKWRPAGAAAAVLVICAVLTVTFSTNIAAYAEELIAYIEAKLNPASESEAETFAGAVFGDDSISTDHGERLSVTGRVLDDPDQERVPADQDGVKRLVGDLVENVEAEVQLGDYIYTFEQLVMDENGMGTLAYTISNPNGVEGWMDNGYGMISFCLNEEEKDTLLDPVFTTSSGASICEKTLLRSDISTDTELHLVAYLAGDWQEGDSLLMELGLVSAYNEGGYLEYIDKQTVSFTPDNFAEAVTLKDEAGNVAEISPLGMMLDIPAIKDPIIMDCIIHYVDGTEYVVEGNGYMNHVTGFMGEDANYTVFNRLADVNQIESLTLKVDQWIEDAASETREEIDRTYIPVQ